MKIAKPGQSPSLEAEADAEFVAADEGAAADFEAADADADEDEEVSPDFDGELSEDPAVDPLGEGAADWVSVGSGFVGGVLGVVGCVEGGVVVGFVVGLVVGGVVGGFVVGLVVGGVVGGFVVVGLSLGVSGSGLPSTGPSTVPSTEP